MLLTYSNKQRFWIVNLYILRWKQLPEKKEENNIPVNKGRYQKLIGKLIYKHARPDIGFATSAASQFINSPTKKHMD